MQNPFGTAPHIVLAFLWLFWLSLSGAVVWGWAPPSSGTRTSSHRCPSNIALSIGSEPGPGLFDDVVLRLGAASSSLSAAENDQPRPAPQSPQPQNSDACNKLDFQNVVFRVLLSCALVVSLCLASSTSSWAQETQALTPETPTTSRSSLASASGKRYWTIMESGLPEEKAIANEALLEYAVGTTSTMYYDNSGGAYFVPRDFYSRFRALRDASRNTLLAADEGDMPLPQAATLTTREGVVQSMKWLISTLGDPFSKYLTREELRAELTDRDDGFLGSGAVVEMPSTRQGKYSMRNDFREGIVLSISAPSSNRGGFLSVSEAESLPVVTAIKPNSPAERAGLVVGDRVVAVGSDCSFLDLTSREEVSKALQTWCGNGYSSPTAAARITVAKPVVRSLVPTGNIEDAVSGGNGDWPSLLDREVVIGYRSSRVQLVPVTALSSAPGNTKKPAVEGNVVSGGNAIAHYKLLTSVDSIYNTPTKDVARDADYDKVGYVRLTRFSKASTEGFLEAIEVLEAAGAQSYVLDLRNNYGGVIQESMMLASTLLRDPHAVLCYTLNSRGGFTPHDVQEYVVDKRFPGYLLSSEPKSVTYQQVRQEHPEWFVDDDGGGSPPSSFASLREQSLRRGIRRGSAMLLSPQQQLDGDSALRAQKNIVILVNEGTASAAEVFASALHDNGRLVALVGTKTYGKGLIQHTFPMPDGGGLRLTVSEYLTPSLRHVTQVGSARFGGSGIRPDVLCSSQQGIPGNIGADFCVGVALDALEDARTEAADDELGGDGNFAFTSGSSKTTGVKRSGGPVDGARVRRAISAGAVRDDF